ncbi:MAG: phosphopantetheine-binding protein [Campylobacteraceae bacterium]|jgi:acyl carrier protein|nr:phosphopantetheine-binding protein [Campylobacteraceae bacterium]
MKISAHDLKELLIKSLKLEDINPNDINDEAPLFGEEGLGLDSVDSIELVLTLEREYGIKIGKSENYQEIFGSVSSLLNHINANG